MKVPFRMRACNCCTRSLAGNVPYRLLDGSPIGVVGTLPKTRGVGREPGGPGVVDETTSSCCRHLAAIVSTSWSATMLSTPLVPRTAPATADGVVVPGTAPATAGGAVVPARPAPSTRVRLARIPAPDAAMLDNWSNCCWNVLLSADKACAAAMALALSPAVAVSALPKVSKNSVGAASPRVPIRGLGGKECGGTVRPARDPRPWPAT